MATAYVRLRMLWGALDMTAAQGQTPAYSSSQIVSGGSSAKVASGVGVRRASLVIDRTTEDPGADNAFMHFDFLNTTSGSPDDTWVTSDYTVLETAMSTWWGACGAYIQTNNKLIEYRWHRTGTGVSKPNPAERVTTITPSGGLGSPGSIPQVACSITFRTAVRKSWGRTYLPISIDAIGTNGRPKNVAVDAIATATNTLVTTAATADMHLVVVSQPLASSLNVERIEVDNVADVIRRRRWKATTYRKLLP
jgi:hypothetical protein